MTLRLALTLLAASFVSHAQPIADHHQHFLRAAAAPPAGAVLEAKDLIARMDASGIRRAVVLSIAYQLANPNRPPVENEYEKVKAENDWTRDQAALYPKRLKAFCGVNPLKDYAIAEINRCAADPRTKDGLKFHFGNSDVDLDKPETVEKMQAIFREANKNRMAIVAHIHSTISQKRPWGAKQAKVFIEKLLPEAPHITVQIAHMAGAGNYDAGVDAALRTFADAITTHDHRTRRVIFDLSVSPELDGKSVADQIALRIRQIGLDRIYFASDAPPAEGIKQFRKLPLTDKEFRKIEHNVAPYLKR